MHQERVMPGVFISILIGLLIAGVIAGIITYIIDCDRKKAFAVCLMFWVSTVLLSVVSIRVPV